MTMQDFLQFIFGSKPVPVSLVMHFHCLQEEKKEDGQGKSEVKNVWVVEDAVPSANNVSGESSMAVSSTDTQYLPLAVLSEDFSPS